MTDFETTPGPTTEEELSFFRSVAVRTSAECSALNEVLRERGLDDIADTVRQKVRTELAGGALDVADMPSPARHRAVLAELEQETRRADAAADEIARLRMAIATMPEALNAVILLGKRAENEAKVRQLETDLAASSADVARLQNALTTMTQDRDLQKAALSLAQQHAAVRQLATAHLQFILRQVAADPGNEFRAVARNVLDQDDDVRRRAADPWAVDHEVQWAIGDNDVYPLTIASEETVKGLGPQYEPPRPVLTRDVVTVTGPWREVTGA